MAKSESGSILELQELWKEITAVEEAYRQQKICWYRPLTRTQEQTKFHHDDHVAVRLVLGSNRSSKSTVGVMEAIAHSLGYRPWLSEDHPDRTVRLCNGDPIPIPNIGRIIAQDFAQAIAQNIWPKIQEWAPQGWYKAKKNNQGVVTKVTWLNGSVMWLMSNEQDDMVFEGTNGHWFWADEPIGYRKYIALKRGLTDFSGHCWMTMTPLTEPWIADVIWTRADEEGSSVRVYKFSIYDNCRDYGGYLDRADIDEFLRDVREDELEARLHGGFLHLAGRVFKEWEPREPFWVPAFPIPPEWPRVCIVDPHPRKPVAVLWIAVTPTNQLVVYRELYDNKLRTVRDVANKMKELEGWTYNQSNQTWYRTERSEPVAIRLMDNSAKEHERTSGTNIWKMFADEGLFHKLANKRNADAGYNAIHEALKIRYEWGEPALVILNICKVVKQNMLNFVYDEWGTSRQRDLKGEKQEVRKANDDMIDCIRYYFQTQITYRLLRGEMNRLALTDFDSEVSRHREEDPGCQTYYASLR